MSADPETRILEAVGRIVAAGVPDLCGRVLLTRAVPTDKRYWPCALVNAGQTRVETGPGKNPGRRMQTCDLVVSVHLLSDGQAAGFENVLRGYGAQATTALFADPSLREDGPKPLAANLILASLATDVAVQSQAVIGVRRLDFIVTYLTHETAPGEIVSR